MFFFLRESIYWLLACGVIGWLIGRSKGLPRQGFFLGLIFGPIGVGITLMLPKVKEPGPTCPRCRKRVGRHDKACPHCGNVLVTVHYRVEDDGKPEGG
jgi:hypothetical protein